LNRAGVVPASAAGSELTAVFLNNRQIQWYNARYRGKNYPTDVLSFPVNEVTAEGCHYLGDLLVSVEKAVAQAREKNHPPERELQLLLLHGMIHLLGFDHEADSGEMDRLERRLRRQVITRRRLIL
jgi:probable rRNA maturation factor